MGVLLSTLLKATPLVLAAMGGVISERAGVINFALEGMMLSGAFTAVWVSHKTGNPYLGLAAAIAAGVMVALLHAVASLWLRVNQVVSSVALNLLALGVTGALLQSVFDKAGTSPSVASLPGMTVAGYEWNVLVLAALATPWLVWLFMRHTVAGLHIRAAGEGVDAARAAGVRVKLVKTGAVLASGVFAGAAGAFVSGGF
jgi:simple sugar transport system permease protein